MKALSLSLSLLLLSLFAIAQDVAQIPEYLNKSDWQSISALMDEDVDMTVLDEEDLYPRKEATAMLRTFIEKNPCSSFKVVHEGTSKLDSRYKIGEYSSNSGVYRITYFLFDNAGNTKIRQLRIEEL